MFHGKLSLGRFFDALQRDLPAEQLAHNIHEELAQMGITLDRKAAASIVQRIHELLLDKRDR